MKYVVNIWRHVRHWLCGKLLGHTWVLGNMPKPRCYCGRCGLLMREPTALERATDERWSPITDDDEVCIPLRPMVHPPVCLACGSNKICSEPRQTTWDTYPPRDLIWLVCNDCGTRFNPHHKDG